MKVRKVLSPLPQVLIKQLLLSLLMMLEFKHLIHK